MIRILTLALAATSLFLASCECCKSHKPESCCDDGKPGPSCCAEPAKGAAKKQ